MDIRAALKTQYHASLAMLREAVSKCPEALWNAADPPVAFWRVAYHTLFFTHFYLQRDKDSFEPWEHARPEYQILGHTPWPPYRPPKIGEPYSREQILQYWLACDAMVDGCVDAMDLDAQECGFPWYDLPKLDHQINNIRHIQHHTGILASRLRAAGDLEVKWRGRA